MTLSGYDGSLGSLRRDAIADVGHRRIWTPPPPCCSRTSLGGGAACFGIGNLCIGVETFPGYHARDMTDLLLAGHTKADANRAVGLNSARAGAPADTDDWVVRSLRTDPSCSSTVLGMLDFVTVQPPRAATSRVAAVDSSCPRRTHRRRDVLYTSLFRQTRR